MKVYHWLLVFQMRPTCLPTSPATCPPRAPSLTDRTATSHQRAAAAISICLHPLVASTCSLKTWTVKHPPPLFFVLKLNLSAASRFSYMILFLHPFRSLSAGYRKWSRHGGCHRSSALPLSRSNQLTASPRQHVLHWPIRGLHRSVQKICQLENVLLISIPQQYY